MGLKPHTLSGQEKLIFKILAKHAVSVMELKLSIDQLDRNFTELKEERRNRLNNEVKLRSMFESFTDAYFLLGVGGEVIDFNQAASNYILNKYEAKLNHGDILVNILDASCHRMFNNCFEQSLHGNKKQLTYLADHGRKGRFGGTVYLSLSGI